MKEAMKLLLAFSPWLAFWFISGPSMLRLRIAIIVAAVLVLIMGITKLHRGSILWAGYIFFAFTIISVVWLENMWVIQHLGLLAPATLFISVQLSILLGYPFTEQYAKEQTPEEFWNKPEFIRSIYISSTIWATIFLTNFFLNLVKFTYRDIPEWYFSIAEYAVILAGIIITSVKSEKAKKLRQLTKES